MFLFEYNMALWRTWLVVDHQNSVMKRLCHFIMISLSWLSHILWCSHWPYHDAIVCNFPQNVSCFVCWKFWLIPRLGVWVDNKIFKIFKIFKRMIFESNEHTHKLLICVKQFALFFFYSRPHFWFYFRGLLKTWLLKFVKGSPMRN